ncbi:MAG: hypothetical protein M1822_005746 [Bathelium mastoideum]|nr:MAG: hypothetical protein M1822_005746 [Bathelium mastoideum]
MFLKSAKGAWMLGKFIYKFLRQRLDKSYVDTKDIFAFLQQCSDTTATRLAAVTFYLTGSPRCYRRACEEVRAVFASQETRLGPRLNSCHFLRACTDEALCLSPPGNSAPCREVDRRGATIDGGFFPAGCEVGTAVYAIHHDTRYWEEPWNYMPER